ncbi:MAG: MATE family efflux transporter [Tissierellia bacterium]|nr:MATE family efflux transporter [Tissierellia bacterium]
MVSNKSFFKMIQGVVIPLALQNLINVAVMGADVLMLGKVSEKTLSAASLANQIQFVMTLIFFGIASGSNVLTAQYYGKGDMDTVKKIFGMALRLSLKIGLVITILVWFFPDEAMKIFTSDPEVIALGIKYLRIICISYIFSAISMSYLISLRSVGQVAFSTMVYFISLIVNIILNSILIFGLFGAPRLLIQGAAIGTLIARFVEVLLCYWYSKSFGKLKLSLKSFKVKNKILQKDFYKYSIPVIMNELLWGSGIAMTAAIIGHIGSEAAAANSVIQLLRQLAMVLCFGLASGTAVILGKFLGQKEMDVAKEYGKKFLQASFLTGSIGALVMILLLPILLPFLSISPLAKEYLHYMIKVTVFYALAQSLNATLVVGIFRAGGLTKLGLYFEIGALWGVSVLCGWLAAFVFQLDFKIVYLIILADEWIKLLPVFYFYKKGIWLNHLTRENM